MTKEEQIEEITKLINSKEKYPCEDYVHCENCFCANKDTAEKLYDAGYHKIDEFEKRLSDKYVEIDNLNRDYSNAFERLKSQQQEIGALKAKNEQLKAKLEKIPLAIKQKMMEEDDYELTEREQATLFLDRMGSDVEILHDIVENLDELLGKGIDGVEGLKDMWERAAVMEFAKKVKEKYSVYDDRHVLYRIIDELLKEYE